MTNMKWKKSRKTNHTETTETTKTIIRREKTIIRRKTIERNLNVTFVSGHFKRF